MTLSDYGFRPPFYTCPVCKDKIPSEVYSRHRGRCQDGDRGAGRAGTSTRPEPEAMTTSEVAKVLGVSAATVLYKVNTGKLRCLPKKPGRGHPVWISTTALKKYISEQSKKTDVAVKWAATGVLDG